MSNLFRDQDKKKKKEKKKGEKERDSFGDPQFGNMHDH